ncbi:Stalked cell differentiation-controlling protein [Thiorhodovibrio winogradskyi]|uniref:diguanylate cyclase n=1 Tax=Thiorhodovibrio winogradskyi TaxID=77007 RepID=A0ABZ0SK88_9GAMM|nr:diguanylate cyclase [Thiorhodovibrio winogradskyi]
MANPEDLSWKDKYLQTLDSLEQEQKTREQSEQTLRQALSRLSLAVDTKDRQLNAELESLRKTVRGAGSLHQIKQLMEEISASILRLDQRQGSVRGIEDALNGFERSLEQILVPEGLRKNTKELKKRLQAASKNADLREALAAYQSYTAEILEWLGNQSSEEKTSLFGRLLGRRGDTPGTPEQEAPEPGAKPDTGSDAQAGPDSMGAAKALDTPLDEIKYTLPPATARQASDADRPEQDQAAIDPPSGQNAPLDPAARDLPPFNQVLFDLVSRLDLPVELSPQAQRISQQLHQPPTVELAGTAVGDIADLVAKARLRVEQEKKDIEQFLSQLTDRLQEIDRHLSESFGQRERASVEGSAIDANMSAEVEQIHRSVAEANDFSGLKSSIKAHLENIQTQMEARKKLEQAQLKLAQAEAAHLRESLAKVERESQELRKNLQQARKRALHDTLTGLHNRLAYDERIEQELERWTRYAHPAVLSIWDIDYFKRINDNFGHNVGDNALKAVAKLLQESTRKSDFLARFGGEEFMMLLPETDIETALDLANRVREQVAAKRFQYRGQPVPLSISCGLAAFIEKDTAEEVYRRADIALYRAKSSGRNCCVFFEPSMLSAD